MRVRIDADNCTSCGLCWDAKEGVPQVFKMGKDQIAEVKNPEVPWNLRDEVLEIVNSCQMDCIDAELSSDEEDENRRAEAKAEEENRQWKESIRAFGNKFG